tara:strand:- start:2042 stop:3394 length:1353 start_codon:yes stop_codon:yes gene_type:complete
MAVPILMPSLSPTMTEGNLAKWCKNVGDEIKPGDIIAEVETDKATMEIEAIDEGVLDKVLFEDGAEGIAVNSLIAVLKSEDDTDEKVKELLVKYKGLNEVNSKEKLNENNEMQDVKNKEINEIKGLPKASNEAVKENIIADDKSNEEINNYNEEKENNIQIDSINTNKFQDRIIASPLAKRLAIQNKIDLKNINGTGPKGRIVKKDIDLFLNKNNEILNISNKHNKNIKISSMRKVIADRLSFSKNNIPHFYLNINCNVDNLLMARQQMNENVDEKNKISINDIIIKALALSLNKVPEANCSWGERDITYYGSVDISVAVAVKDGLFTPVIRSAEVIQISEISKLMKDFVYRAKEGKLKPSDYEGGNFSISNLGMYNIDSFSAIINPPQSGILAVGAIKKLPVVIGEEIKISNTLSCQLSGDHRVIDGAVGAQLLNEFKSIIENPYKMLL